jgi:hypothetical protein
VSDSNLYDLRKKVPVAVSQTAQAFAREQADKWSYGIYSSNDFTIMFEKGYLEGYLDSLKNVQEFRTEQIIDKRVLRDNADIINLLEIDFNACKRLAEFVYEKKLFKKDICEDRLNYRYIHGYEIKIYGSN